jgi:kynurenine formamidase
MLIDLSHKIVSDMPSYPDDTITKIDNIKDLDKDGYALSEYHTSLHTGTHIDFPSHLIKSDKTAADYPLTRFMSKGILFDVQGIEKIGIVDGFDKIEQDDIVILYTGYEKLFNKDLYFTNHPVLTEQAAKYLIKRKISMIGFDMPSPDNYPFAIHKLFMENDILILENLDNLDTLKSSFKSTDTIMVYAFPLKICAEASQVRVIAETKSKKK